MKKNLLVFFYSITLMSYGQITFQKTYGGANDDDGRAIAQANDGGYILAGTTQSFGAGNPDIYLIKTDVDGETLWTKTYGGTGLDGCNDIEQTTDGGYIITGFTLSFSPGQQIYLIKTDASGNILWSKIYGESVGLNRGYSARQANDGGYIIAGQTNTIGAGSNDAYIIKTNSLGDTLWTRAFGLLYDDYAYSVGLTTDGGYVVCGQSRVISNGPYYEYLIRLNSNGDTLWTRRISGTNTNTQVPQDIKETFSRGFIICGYYYNASGGQDIFLMHTDSVGNEIWTRRFTGTGTLQNNSVYSVIQNNAGEFVIAGATNDFNANGPYDIIVISTNSSGNFLWAKTYGGNSNDATSEIIQTSDGGYAVLGNTHSFGSGGSDFYLIKTDSNGNVGCNVSIVTPVMPTYTSVTDNTNSNIYYGNTTSIPPTQTGTGGTVTTICIPTDVNETRGEEEMINLFPNPAMDELRVKNVELKIRRVEIFNLFGEQIAILKPEANSQELLSIDISWLKAGIYFIAFTDDKRNKVTRKFVKL